MTNWQTKKLGDVLEKIEGGGTPSKEKKEFWNGSIPWASVKDLTSFNPKETQDYITDEGLKNSSSRLIKAGTLITPTRMALGFTVRFDIDVAINQDLKALYPIDDMSTEYIQYWFEAYRKTIERLGTGSTVAGIQVGELRALKIQVPEKPEQERIVGILEVWDEYIEKLEQKIALKEQLKKGLMQQLLTGNRRLPGFSGEWRNVKLGELGNIIRGVSYNPKEDLLEIDTDSSVRLLRSNNVQKREIILNDVQIVGRTKVRNDQLLQDNDIVVCMANGSKRLVGKSALFNRSDGFLYTVGAFMAVYRRNESTASLLAEYLFATSRYEYYIASTLSGSSINNLKGSDIESMDFRVPFDDEEALAISGVLDTCQDEISKLMLKRRRIIEQKKYLLKNLITGTIRTPEDLKPLDTTRLERSAL